MEKKGARTFRTLAGEGAVTQKTSGGSPGSIGYRPIFSNCAIILSFRSREGDLISKRNEKGGRSRSFLSRSYSFQK